MEFQCSECSFSASKKRTLKTHVLAKHRGVVRYNCSQCEFKNYRKDLVEIHIETFHSGEEAQVLYLNSPEFAAWNYGDNSRRKSKSVGGYVKRTQTRSRQTRKLTSKPAGMFQSVFRVRLDDHPGRSSEGPHTRHTSSGSQLLLRPLSVQILLQESSPPTPGCPPGAGITSEDPQDNLPALSDWN